MTFFFFFFLLLDDCRSNKKRPRPKNWLYSIRRGQTRSTSVWQNCHRLEPSKLPSSKWIRRSLTEKESRYIIIHHLIKKGSCSYHKDALNRNCWQCCQRMRNVPRFKRLSWPILTYHSEALSSSFSRWPPSLSCLPDWSYGSSNPITKTWKKYTRTHILYIHQNVGQRRGNDHRLFLFRVTHALVGSSRAVDGLETRHWDSPNQFNF